LEIGRTEGKANKKSLSCLSLNSLGMEEVFQKLELVFKGTKMEYLNLKPGIIPNLSTK